MHQFTVDAARSLPGPRWLTERRVAAAEVFVAAEPPTAAEEEWRYSAIADLDLGSYRFARGVAARALPAVSKAWDSVGDLETATDRDDPTDGTAVAVVDVADGQIVAGRGLERLADLGVFVGPIIEAPDGAELLGSVSDDASDYFTRFNDAFTCAPVVVDVPVGVVVDGPIVIRHHACTTGTASFPRLVVRLGRDAQAAVLDVQRSAGTALVVPVVELDVGPAARLGYMNLQQHDRRAWQVAAHTVRVERDAALTAASVALGGAYARTRVDTRLVGRGASGDLLSAYFGSDEQIIDFRTFQDHAAPDTTSNLLYKGAVGHSARSVYTGLIRVRPDARGTNAFQTNRNLKLSEDAWVESVPNLVIENHDVRCSHASAVGPVDPDQVFYLESRGVPTTAAERLIVAGFFDEVIDRMPVPSTASQVRQALRVKLDQMLGPAA